MYTGKIIRLINDIDFTDDDPAQQIEGCTKLIETLLAQLDHIQDYQEYLDALSNVTYH
jgi:hypothetical protein